MLAHKGTVELKTEHLRLRRYTVEDYRVMYDTWASDPDVTRYLTWPVHDSPAVTKSLLEDWVARYVSEDNYHWAIELDGLLIGDISVVHISERDENAELGYCMGKAYWNKGIMTEAASEVTRFLFEEVGFHRLEIDHAVKNPGSGRVAQKCGYLYEGTKRERFRKGDAYLDVSMYGLLQDHWKKRNGNECAENPAGSYPQEHIGV